MSPSVDSKSAHTRSWTLTLPRDRNLALGGWPRVMGILNLTPDSFSDGGLWSGPEEAVEGALTMFEAGAAVVDLGAESTRPGGGVYGEGAEEVSPQEELDRLMPVLEKLRKATDAPLSVDTRKGAVAREALAAGADMINDVSALSDAELGRAVRDARCPLVLMHSRGDLRTMQEDPHYDDLLREIKVELGAAMDRALAFGIPKEQVVVDPGLGFGKSYAHSLSLLAHLDALLALGRPVMVGASRKSFIGHLTGGAPPRDRLAGSLAAAGLSADKGAALLRVHDVADTVRFLQVWEAIRETE